MVSPSIASSDDDPFALERYLIFPKKPSPSLRSTSSEEEDPFGLEKYVKPTSIMDRKIQTRGLGTSFSSNIGRRFRMPKTPTRTNHAGKGNDDSRKKVIYNWLEKTKESSPLKQLQTMKRERTLTMSTSTGRSKSEFDHDSIRTYETPVHKSYITISESPLPNTPTAPESYELNLLNYKQFFNNRPLHRCLDEGQPEGEFFQRERPVLATKSADDILPIDLACHEQKETTKILSEKAAETVGGPDAVYSDSEYSEDHEEMRDLEEVRKFWSTVRSQLWIPDDEIDHDREAGEQEEQEASVPSPLTPITPQTPKTPKTDFPKTPSPSPWVMMAAPTKWSYSSSMDRGNIDLGEHNLLVPDLPSRPHSLHEMDTDDKIQVMEGLSSESEEGWAAHQRQSWQKNSMPGERIDYYKDHKQMREKMASFDEFLLATISPKRPLHLRTRSRRPTF